MPANHAVRPDWLTEVELRDCLRAWLAHRTGAHARVIEEFSIERGAARVDFATLGDSLHGFEIKSDYDGFSRLSNQIHAYNRVFARVWILTGPHLAGEIEGIVPRWWGLLRAGRDDRSGALTISVHRAALENPRREAFSIASLLWREEARALLDAHGAPAPRKTATHYELCERLCAAVPLRPLEQAVNQRLLARHGATASTR